jgi:hypothetical protein
MDRTDMATTAHSKGNRPRQPITRDLRCVFSASSAPLSLGSSRAVVVTGGRPIVKLVEGQRTSS